MLTGTLPLRLCVAALLLTACSAASTEPVAVPSGPPPGGSVASPAAVPSGGPPTSAAPSVVRLGPPSPAQGFGPAVTVQVGDLPPVRAEVASTAEQRAFGLMQRADIPIGTGMLFRYDSRSQGNYYMYDVKQPLVAAFVRDNRVIHVAEMPPCPAPQPEGCPTYGPGEAPYDMVVETVPATWGGRARVGDPVTVS